jgi:hypothetical protein
MPILRRWYYAVPPVYLALILWLQPADRFVMITSPHTPEYPLQGWASRLLSDDSDTIAYALRAENAARGRKAGLTAPLLFGRTTGWRHPTHRPEEFDTRLAPYEPPGTFELNEFEVSLTRPVEPLDRYFLEYPPLALDLFRLGHIAAPAGGTDVNPALLDSHQFNVICHPPGTPEEVQLYRRLRHATRVYALLMTLAQLGLMLLTDRCFPGSPTWLLVLPGFLYFTACRFDVLPAFLVMASVAAADRRKVAVAGLCLGLAVALKMYPLVLAPILLRFTARSWKDAVVWCACVALPMVLSNARMWLTDGTEGVKVPFLFQLGRDPEPHWCFYGKFLPPELSFKTPIMSAVRTAIPLVVSVFWSVRRPPDVNSLLRRCVLAVGTFLTVAVFYSPQWWQWLAVLLVPLALRHRWLVWVVLFLDVWTYLHFPIMFDAMVTDLLTHGDEAWDGWDVLRIVHVWARGVVWLAMMGALVWHELRAGQGDGK